MKPAQQMTNGSFSIDSVDLPLQLQQQQNCRQQSLPDELGSGQSTIFQLDHDLSYIDTRYTPSKDLAILSQIDNQEPRLVVTLGLKGHSRFAGRSADDVFFNEGYTTITTFNSSVGERHYQADKPIRQLRLSIGKHWIAKYFSESKTAHLFNKNKTQVISHRPISAQGILSAQLLTASSVTPDLRLLFMHGQAMTILAAELAHIFEDNHQKPDPFNQKDKSIAEEAKDILFDEFKNPPSITELSKRVGTNPFKLKKLFHHFFDNTPYGLLSEFRMHRAYQLLESTHFQVGVVADLVGYSHASNFTTAFTARFGIPPKAVSKKN